MLRWLNGSKPYTDILSINRICNANVILYGPCVCLINMIKKLPIKWTKRNDHNNDDNIGC